MPLEALPADVRARLFDQWAVLEVAGVPPLQALAQLGVPSTYRARLSSAAALLAKGQPLATAALSVGLFTQLETKVVAAASRAGSLERAFQRLADRARREHARGASLITRLLVPLVLLAAMLLIIPLPSLIGGQLGAGRYLLQSVGVLGLIGAAIFVLLRAQRQAAMSGTDHLVGIDSAVLSIPWLGRLIRRDQLQQFADTLALLLEAGIPLQSALPDAAETVRWPSVRAALLRWQSALLTGSTLAQAASAHPIADSEPLLATIAAGEGAGSLAQSLGHYARLTAHDVESDKKLLADWIPRVVYLLVVLAVASSLISAFGSLLGGIDGAVNGE